MYFTLYRRRKQGGPPLPTLPTACLHNELHCSIVTVVLYRIALNFRGAQFSHFSRIWENRAIYAPRNFLTLLLAATSSSRLALAGLLSKEIPTSSISTANSDVAKVLELKDSKK